MKIEEILDLARIQASKSLMRSKHGCVIVKKGKVVAEGFNRYVFGCNAKKTLSIHAEVDAISKCSKQDINEAILYVVRLGTDGYFKMSKPCHHCTNRISRTNLSGVYYSVGNLN